jgi:hypothetical protein
MRWVVLLCCLIPLFPRPAAATTVHVAPNGDDRNDGSAERPFATFERARDAVRAFKEKSATQVIVHGGTYVFDKPFELSAADSGTWEAAAGESVRIAGGPKLPADAFQEVTDDAVRARLKENARGQVRQLDLSKFGNSEIADYPQKFRGMPAVPELFFNDRRMNVARWPNQSWTTIAKFVETGSIPRDGDNSNKPGVFEYAGDEPSRWNLDAGVWLQGYWCFDWHDEAIRVRSIDKSKRQITLDAPAVYGVRQGNPAPRRFRALNVLEELDEPGEFYIDRAAKRLYFWPPEKLDAKARIVLSTLNGPLLRVKDAAHVTVRGFTFEACLSNGIEVIGGQDVRLVGCTVRNVREMGIRVTGGTDHHVERCDITETGTGGLALEGGDRKTLTPAHHEAADNHIWNFSRHQPTGSYAITLGGVGNRAAHNLIHDAPHQAVLINGNDHVFELNVVRNVVTETDDAGAVYKGRNPSCRGNIIRNNLFSDIGASFGHASCAVYFDDGDGGDLVVGNVFVRCGNPTGTNFGAIFSHGGHGIRAENNLFIDCPRALGSAPWDDARWKNALNGGEDCHFPEKLLKEVDITKPPYTTRYPELVGFMDPKPGEPRVSRATNNVLVRTKELASGNWTSDKDANWQTDVDPGFVDAAKGNYQLRADSDVFKHLPAFKPIPFDQIGPRSQVTPASRPVSPPGVRVDEAQPDIERFAATELQRYLRLLHADLPTTFLVGSPKTNPAVRQALDDSGWPSVGEQTIVLKRATLDGKAVFVVGGGSPRATLWAVYELVQRWGVRFLLDRDVLPNDPGPLPLPEHAIVLEPNLTVRQWRVMNAHACGPESWGIADYRPLIDQLAKLKFNRLLVYIWPWHPFVDFEVRGVKRSSATLWFGERYPITPDMPGRALFGADETEFWNPDLPPRSAGYAATLAAAERLLHEIMAHAHARGMECVVTANLGEFPGEFGPVIRSAEPVQQIGRVGTVVPGATTPLDDPGLAELTTNVLRATVRTYPEADLIELGMQEHRQWAGEYECAWKALDAKYGVERVRPLATILADAQKRTGYPGGAARAVQEVKGDLVALYLYDKLLATGAAKRADGSQPRILFDGVAEELYPVLPHIVPKGSELLNFIDYTPTRILKRREVLSRIPGKAIPSTLIYTLHDDNVGLLPQLATGSLHGLTREIRKAGWAGFSTRYWLAGDHDACVAYLSQAAWDKEATPDSAYADHLRAVYGDAAGARMKKVLSEVEAATLLLEEHGLGFAFPTPNMLMQHWTAQPLDPAFTEVGHRYRTALDAAREAEKVSSDSGRPLARYWIGRLRFGAGYLDAVQAVRRAAAAEASGKSDEPSREAKDALAKLRESLEAYANVARDRSDRGAIAVLAEYAYRPHAAKVAKLDASK